jgi:hypothetical protein
VKGTKLPGGDPDRHIDRLRVGSNLFDLVLSDILFDLICDCPKAGLGRLREFSKKQWVLNFHPQKLMWHKIGANFFLSIPSMFWQNKMPVTKAGVNNLNA